MQLHERCQWDPEKAKANVLQHGVKFEDARDVLEQADGEIYLLDSYDDEHSGEEDRYCTFGSLPLDRAIVLRISWTDRQDAKGEATRIISARPANRKERNHYVEQIRKRLRGHGEHV